MNALLIILIVQVTANHSISLAQFDYTVEFEEEYREAIASGNITNLLTHKGREVTLCARRISRSDYDNRAEEENQLPSSTNISSLRYNNANKSNCWSASNKKKQSQINDFETRQMRNLISCYFCCPVSDKEHSNIKYFSNSPIANLLRGPHVQEQEPQHNCLKQLASLLTVAFALHPRFMKCSRVPVYSSSNFLYTSQITIMSLHSSFHFKTICTINLKKEFRKTHSLWTTWTCTYYVGDACLLIDHRRGE